MLTRTPRQLCSGAQCTHRTLVRKMGMGFRGGAKPLLCQQDVGSDLPGEPLEAHALSLAEATLNKVSFRGEACADGDLRSRRGGRAASPVLRRASAADSRLLPPPRHVAPHDPLRA